jgi:transposase-like protein
VREYSEAFKSKMVQRMMMPGGPSANALSHEVGVNQPTLSRWLRAATTLPPVKKKRLKPAQVTRTAAPSTSSEAKRPEDRSPEDKFRIVLEGSSLSESALGEYLRRHGIHEADLAGWREAMVSSLGSGIQAPPAKPGEARRVRELEKELRRKDKALAETAALLVLQKKVRAIWGDGDDDTKPGNDD